MFGWEFPPHIAGGLGTACYGMTRGLARNGVEVVFVMPRAYGDEDQRFVRVVNASDVETIGTRDHEFSEELLEKVSFIHIDSNMLPYISPEEYAAYHDEFVRSGRTHELDRQDPEQAGRIQGSGSEPRHRLGRAAGAVL